MLIDQGPRSPTDQGTGGRDFEDYPPEAGPAQVGKAPLPKGSRGALKMGIERGTSAVERRETVKRKATRAAGAAASRAGGKKSSQKS
jgi:hypothetical protein